MQTLLGKTKILSANILKIIAAISMLIDHIGFLFFPEKEIYRIIGRLAFPIFAFFIAEGTKYTKNKLRYFLQIFILAVIMQSVYFLYNGSLEMCIFVTFSLSITLIYSLNLLKDLTFSQNKKPMKIILALLLFLVLLILTFRLTQVVNVDYSFFGVLTPVIVSLFTSKPYYPSLIKKLDNHYLKLLLLAVSLVIVYLHLGWYQLYALISLPILFFYSEKRGKLKLKYFFYAFYPLHLLLLQAVYILIN